jgi:hypothetical protein
MLGGALWVNAAPLVLELVDAQLPHQPPQGTLIVLLHAIADHIRSDHINQRKNVRNVKVIVISNPLDPREQRTRQAMMRAGDNSRVRKRDGNE